MIVSGRRMPNGLSPHKSARNSSSLCFPAHPPTAACADSRQKYLNNFQGRLMLRPGVVASGKTPASQPADDAGRLSRADRKADARLFSILGTLTPKRDSLLLSPGALVQVGGSPSSKRYITMNGTSSSGESLETARRCVKKLNFTK